MIGDLVVGDVASALVAVSPVFEEAAINPSIVDVHALRQQAGDQISQGEQPTSTIQRR
jgi:UDP-N-acetylglucosamine enolpyruvyl transferase